MESVDSTAVIEELLARIHRLEAERDCLNLLACYGYGADYADPDAWLDLFTPDAVVDTISFYGSDLTNPAPSDFRQNRMQGRDELRSGLISGPQSATMADHATQHHMSGNAMNFRMLDENTARVTTYGIVFGKPSIDTMPHVTYQSHTTNRWTFRRSDDGWRISELVRRRMGHPDGARLIERVPGS